MTGTVSTRGGGGATTITCAETYVLVTGISAANAALTTMVLIIFIVFFVGIASARDKAAGAGFEQ